MKKSKKKVLLWSSFVVITVIICTCIGLAAGWFWGHSTSLDVYDPYKELKTYQYSRHHYMIKSAEISVKMAHMAVAALQQKNVALAIQDCKTAIDIFPIDAKPYILLTKLYLMMGQEQKMFETLTLAGGSYPNFNNIVDVIDDDDLNRLPLEEPQGIIYLANFPENKKTAISFMFDDGEANVYKALPIFEKYGFKATIPIVAGFTGDGSSADDPFWGTWAQWKDAANRGFEIANHSMYHTDSLKLHGRDFNVSIDEAKDMIERNIGHKVTAYVFPHDSYNDEAVARALRIHEAIRTAAFLRPYYNRMVDVVIGGPYVSVETAERLADIAINRHLWLIAKCHGVTAKVSMRSFKSITPEFLDTYLAYLHARAQDVWVETFSHVFEYLAQRRATVIETKNATVNSITFDLQNNQSQMPLSFPLTVIIKTAPGAKFATATEANHPIKGWNCDTDKICVDVDSYGADVQVQWQ